MTCDACLTAQDEWYEEYCYTRIVVKKNCVLWTSILETEKCGLCQRPYWMCHCCYFSVCSDLFFFFVPLSYFYNKAHSTIFIMRPQHWVQSCRWEKKRQLNQIDKIVWGSSAVFLFNRQPVTSESVSFWYSRLGNSDLSLKLASSLKALCI